MGLLDNIDPMSLLMGGATMMANSRGRNYRNAIPMGLEQLAQYQMYAQKQQQDAEERKQRQEMFDLQKQQHQLQIDEYNRKLSEVQKQRDAQGRLLGGMSGYIDQKEVPVESFQNVPRTPVEGAVSPDFGLDRQSITTMQKQAVPNAQRYLQDINDAGFGDEMLKRQLFPAPVDVRIAPNGIGYDPTDRNNLGKDFSAQEKLDPNKPFLFIGGKIVANPDYQQYEINKARAGAAQVKTEVGFPKETFKNEKALRDEFNGLPHIKNYSEVKDAYGQIKSALGSVSPAGDLAAATKFMKIIDPGSVVRESELGMALQASGAMDRWSNYLQMYAKGERLTPTQRKDFGDIADKLYQASVDRYNKTADQYRGLADQYELNPDRVVKQIPAEKPIESKQKSKQFDVEGKKVIGVLGTDGNYYVTKNGKKYRVEE